MLKVSALLAVLCGLLASSSAQEVQARVSPQLINDLTQGLLRVGFLPSLQPINFQASLNNALRHASGLLNAVGGPLFSEIGAVGLQVQDPRLLQVSLEIAHQRKEATLWAPLAFGLTMEFPALRPFTVNVQADIRVQLHLEKNLDGSYALAFGNCRVTPETVRTQIGSATHPITKFLLGNIEKILRTVVAHDLGEKLCPVINRWLYELDLHEVNELINLILQQDKFQVVI
ncbi:putative BPIFA4P protein [Lemur catta]|uniref:putative BPIFA4P protein n=1 Tax=Lemur catta TaxID=9447 RepID=UPI001E26B30C|nr:putative BPIFA4P protein [Lemur catta]